jgi:hypothetical protein
MKKIEIINILTLIGACGRNVIQAIMTELNISYAMKKSIHDLRHTIINGKEYYIDLHGSPLSYDNHGLQFKYENIMEPPVYLGELLNIRVTQNDIDYLMYTWKPHLDVDYTGEDDDEYSACECPCEYPGCRGGCGVLWCGCIDVCRGRCGFARD